MVDDYEADVARQPRGPFNKAPERQLLRHIAERYVSRQRYSGETKRRLKIYGGWLGGAPIAIAIYKFVEHLLKGG